MTTHSRRRRAATVAAQMAKPTNVARDDLVASLETTLEAARALPQSAFEDPQLRVRLDAAAIVSDATRVIVSAVRVWCLDPKCGVLDPLTSTGAELAAQAVTTLAPLAQDAEARPHPDPEA